VLKKLSQLLTTLLLGALLLVFSSISVQAAPSDPNIPEGFELVAASMGVRLYQKDYAQGTPDFLQVVDLSQGASLELLHGAVQQPRPGRGAYGGPDSRMNLESLEYYWKDLASSTPNPFCVTNGLFFYMQENPTRLPFPLKKDGEIVTDGYGGDQFPNQKLILEIWEDAVDIRKLSRQALYTSTAPDILAGLTQEANKRAKQYTGRTFVGVDDRNGDRRYEILLVYNTKTARQSDAAQVLTSAGANKVMMLDGGGSTQLICQGQRYVDSERWIPQALGVAGADVPALAADFGHDEWHVVTQGESVQATIRITNSGAVVWQPDQIKIMLSQTPRKRDEVFPVEQRVLPGEGLDFTWNAEPFSDWGIFRVGLSLVQENQVFTPQPARWAVVVLPENLKDREKDLKKEIERWKRSKDVSEVESLVVTWLKQELGDSQEPEDNNQPVVEDEIPQVVVGESAGMGIGKLICLPLLMLPFITAGLILLLRKRKF
jgi:hypothetical protein